MGKEKAGFLTPKAIANRIKAKGLQKLRWYCQMCQKQCRDENGFKCHMMSESHQRQLLLFAENPDEYIDTFSKDFEDGYVELLRRRFGTKRVHCNIVYQEYIAQRDHTHMNSTQWETLTDFVKWLGREGKCEVDYTEKGWFIKYVDKDPETIKRQEQLKAKEKMDMDDDERTARFIQEQVEKGAASERHVPEAEYTEFKRESEDEKVKLDLGLPLKKTDSASGIAPGVNPFKMPSAVTRSDKSGSDKDRSKSAKDSQSTSKTSSKAGEKRKSALDEIMIFEETQKEKKNRRENWLHENIVVKVISKKLGDKYYKKKAYVKEVQNLYGALIKMLDTGDKLRVDQAHLETVIPAQGKTVLIVNGAYRGQQAILEKLHEKDFCCSVSIKSGPLKGRVLEKVPYEDICKIYQS